MIYALLRPALPLLTLGLGSLVGGTLLAQGGATGGSADPEAASGRRAVPVLVATEAMVVAANPHASEAGAAILAKGGSALDAAVAVQAALNVVEPQSSGFGGGAFLLYYDASEGRTYAYDGRETAPAAATPALFMEGDEPHFFWDAVVGGRAVGVPGVARALERAHQAHGRLPWPDLFDDAVALAEGGFEISPRLNALLAYDPFMRHMPVAGGLFYDAEGRPLPVGHLLKQPALARTLRTLAAEGAGALYAGPLAEGIVHAVATARSPSRFASLMTYGLGPYSALVPQGILGLRQAPGLLTLEDLATYEATASEPICLDYRDFSVCGAPPPTSGGVTTLEILGILERFDLKALGPRSVALFHLLTEAERLAYADRGLYVADPSAMDIPPEALLAPEYLKARADLISLEASLGDPAAGIPAEGKAGMRAPDESLELPCTSHFVIVDAQGDVLSMTTSIENVFGARLMAEGMLLNNQLTDFSFVPSRGGRPIANAVGPGKRPRSSMAPLIIFDRATGAPVAALGSPGGSQIIGYVVQAAVNMMDMGMSPQDAVEVPHVLSRGGPTELEAEGWAPGEREAVVAGLEALGHRVQVKDLTSGVHAVSLSKGRIESGADPRREGSPAGR